MKEREALQKALKAIDLLITADNMSSFETSILTDDMRKEVMEYQISAQQALEQSEPRMFSEEQVDEGVNEGVNAGYELSLEPNQTEAEKILEDACPVLFKPNTDVRKAVLNAM